MSELPIQIHPECQQLLDEIVLLREELAHLLTEEHDLVHIVKPNLLALYQKKIGAWELRRLRAQIEALRSRRRLELAQAAVNQGRAPDWAEIDGHLELAFLTWQQRLAEAAEKFNAAEYRLQHLLSPNDDRELKKLYYAFVKKLHPDVNQQLTDEQRQLWQRVQQAYEANDIEELRALALLCDKPGSEIAPQATPDALRADRQKLERQIAEMLRRIEQLESQPPYTLRAQLADEISLDARRAEIEIEIAKFESQRSALDDAMKPLMKTPHDGKKFGSN